MTIYLLCDLYIMTSPKLYKLKRGWEGVVTPICVDVSTATPVYVLCDYACVHQFIMDINQDALSQSHRPSFLSSQPTVYHNLIY